MYGALFFYQYHSWLNRLQARVRRLRQPKYLFGGIVGALYMYYYFFRAFARHGNGPGAGAGVPPEFGELRQLFLPLGYSVILLLAWVLPRSRAALAFTEAEVAFLFPAPITRRTLINFKLLKSQSSILFSALIFTVIGRGLSGGPFLIRLFGWWGALSVFNLHLYGSSFTVTMLMDRGISNWKRRTIFLGVAGALAVWIFIWARRTMPALPVPEAGGFGWLAHFLDEALNSGPLPYLLAPFRLVTAPYFATNYHEFLRAMWPVLCILALHYFWVVQSDVAFEEASVELSRKFAERMTAVRSGNWQAARTDAKASRPPFRLRATGSPWVAVFWKNLISAGRYVTTRVWLILLCAAVFGGMTIQTQVGHGGGGMGLGVITSVSMLLAISLFSGPQLLRNDLRQDLLVADILKMLPMPAWQVVLGEILAPAAILAALQWLLLIFGAIFFPAQFEGHAIAPEARVIVAVSAALVLPLVDLIALIIPNAAVLYFPAWYPLGRDVPRGFETMGQQVILMFGQVMVLMLALLLPATAFTLIFLLASSFLWPLTGILLGAVAAALLLAVEAALGIKLLGAIFGRFDLSAEMV